mgnify:CR=1 FL=1
MNSEAQLFERQKNAEADKFEREKEAEALKATAEAQKYAMEQEAAGIRSKGFAEAEALHQIPAALHIFLLLPVSLSLLPVYARSALLPFEAQINAETLIAQKENDLAICKAELQKDADTKQAIADAAYQIQKETERKTVEVATADANLAKQEKAIALQEKEVELTERTLEATIVCFLLRLSLRLRNLLFAFCP